MDMLLRDVTISELAGIYARHRERSPAPYLIDPKVIRRARRLARANGVWDSLNQGPEPGGDIPVLKGSAFRLLRDTKDRRLTHMGARSAALSRAALALWLGHPKGDVEYLQDLLWAYCEDTTWVHAVHDGRAIDLNSAGMAAQLAEIVYALEDRLEDEVKDRMSREIDKRIFQEYWNYRHLDEWKTGRNNWNHVCNGQIIRTALYEIDDPVLLAHLTHTPIQHLTYALDAFTDDGGCVEGPSYWGYGFGHYVDAAEALFMKTDGELNIMTDEKTERISRYRLAAHIAGPYSSSFADASHGPLSVRTALLINRFHAIPELYELCPRNVDGTLRLGSMHDLALYGGEKCEGRPDPRDYFLSDLGQAKLRGKAGRGQVTLVALAGRNDVPHNHNDVGSFIVHKWGKLSLLDPGGPMYTKKTFSPRRYEILFCSSRGHSVPVINGAEQAEGARHFGTMKVENLNGEGARKVEIDMARAYPRGTVKKLVRRFTLDSDTNRLTLEDRYRFTKKPKSVEEAFITFERVTVAKDGASVRIGRKADGLSLKAVDCPGTFGASRLVEESKDGRTDDVITRITFVPKTLAKEMHLTFEIE